MMMMTNPEMEPAEPEVESSPSGVYNLMIHRNVAGSDPLVGEPLGDGR
jgi:hypothetical protein